MMTRRGVLMDSLRYTGLLAAAALVAGCGDDSGGTSTVKPSAEVENLDKKAAEARAKAAAEKGKK